MLVSPETQLNVARLVSDRDLDRGEAFTVIRNNPASYETYLSAVRGVIEHVNPDAVVAVATGWSARTGANADLIKLGDEGVLEPNLIEPATDKPKLVHVVLRNPLDVADRPDLPRNYKFYRPEDKAACEAARSILFLQSVRVTDNAVADLVKMINLTVPEARSKNLSLMTAANLSLNESSDTAQDLYIPKDKHYILVNLMGRKLVRDLIRELTSEGGKTSFPAQPSGLRRLLAKGR